jgi:hypothetical protein
MIRELDPEGKPIDIGALELRSQLEPLDLGAIALHGSLRREPIVCADTHPAERRDLTRPLTALLALGLGLLGAIYVSKRYSEAHVIVVPATANEHSVIT